MKYLLAAAGLLLATGCRDVPKPAAGLGTSTTSQAPPSEIGSRAFLTADGFANVGDPLVRLTFGEPVGTFPAYPPTDTIHVCNATVTEVLAGDAKAGTEMLVPCALDGGSAENDYNGLGHTPPGEGTIETVFLVIHGRSEPLHESVTSGGATTGEAVTAIYPVTLNGPGAQARTEPSPFTTSVTVDLEQYRALLGNKPL